MLGQVQVAEKGSEITAFTALLDPLDLDDVLVTADALHTQRAHADYLHRRGGHYLMTIKANQPTLLARVRALPWTQIGVADRQRGRGTARPRRDPHDQRGQPAPLSRPGRRVLPPRIPGDQAGAPASPTAAWREVENRDRLRDHQPDQHRRRSRTARPPGSVGTGRSRIACTGSVMSASTKTAPPPTPVTPRRSCRRCGTSRSPRYACTASATSPQHSATTPATPIDH
nr:transposase [Pseudonocardia sp. ICBG601]